MKPRKLTLKDKPVFSKYLGLSRHQLSYFSFENIYIWKKLYAISWLEIKDNLCVFFQDNLGCFLYLPPLGKKIRPETVKEAFRIMDQLNPHPEISRIDNAEEKEIVFYQRLGYVARGKYPEYLCARAEQAELKGNKFKSKRASYNYFIKHYKFSILPFNLRDKGACLKLYHSWMEKRRALNQDVVYQGMLKDSLSCLEVLLKDYRQLGIVGRIVKVGGKIKAFTFGFRLNREIFCILYEITDLSVKGLAQFIFRQFCAQLAQYKYINIMDDSGLENLRKVKLSYHPARFIPAYIITRRNS